jgi:cytochrome c oxidase subunit 3
MSALTGGRIALERGAGLSTPGPYPIGLVGILATVVMLFAAFTAALLVRRAGTDWIPMPLPLLVWPNTAVLVASSAAVELARRAIRRGGEPGPALWVGAAGALGALFLVGQVIAWRQLAARGAFLATNPHAAFFYTLSALHGVHVVGGLAALAWTARRAARGTYKGAHHSGLTHAAIYWHVVAGVWAYLLVVLSTL